jgi:hypothetical protein
MGRRIRWDEQHHARGRIRRRWQIGMDVPPGIGELGLIAPENRRTQALECVEDGDVLTMGHGSVEQLYLQDRSSPKQRDICR